MERRLFLRHTQSRHGMGPDLHFSGTGSSERRAVRRYPVQARIHYWVNSGSGRMITGFGRTLDISSRGLMFQAAEPLPLGAYIEADLPWPAHHSLRRLKVALKGHIVRVEGNSTAITIQDQHFQRMKLREILASSRN